MMRQYQAVSSTFSSSSLLKMRMKQPLLSSSHTLNHLKQFQQLSVRLLSDTTRASIDKVDGYSLGPPPHHRHPPLFIQTPQFDNFKQIIKEKDIVVFMKGTKIAPQVREQFVYG